jgi:peptidoglycan DL-endopeptidase CwlO
MMKAKKSCATLVAATLLGAASFVVLPASFADTASQPITSSRSFRKMNTVRKDFMRESISSSVDSNSNWGGIESLDVPQTKSQAEKDADAAAAQAAANAEASRAASRESLKKAENYTITPPDAKTADALVKFALQFQGYPYKYGGNTPDGWDCSGFVQYVFGQIGISLPRSSGAQATVGSAVQDLNHAMPGDIIANSGHAAIYIGNGMVMNAMTPASGTGISSVGAVFPSSYSIRRVL